MAVNPGKSAPRERRRIGRLIELALDRDQILLKTGSKYVLPPAIVIHRLVALKKMYVESKMPYAAEEIQWQIDNQKRIRDANKKRIDQ